MANRKISQLEARRTKKQLEDLQTRYNSLTGRYSNNYPGVHFRSINTSEGTRDTVNLANNLGRGVAARMEGDTLKLYAVKP